MDLIEQNLLLFTRSMQAGGTEKVVLQLCEIFNGVVKKIVVCSNGGINVEKLETMSIKHYQIPDIENKAPSVMIGIAVALKKIIKQENITVIHTHHRMASFYIAALRLYKKCVFISTSHNVFRNKKWLTYFACRNGNLIACGETVKKNLIEFYGLEEKKVTVIHNAVKPFQEDIEEDQLIKKLHCKGNYIVGSVGRLSEQKGMEYFIKAVPSVIKKHGNVRFVIIGSGEEEDKLKTLVEEIGVKPYLHFLGYRKDVQNLMAQLDLLVLSSLWEGLPLMPIEAYSVRKTVVATAVDGTLEIIRDGIDGFLVPPRDSEAIANKINYLIDQPSLRCELEKNALERYQSEFSFERFSSSYVAYYKTLKVWKAMKN